MRRSMKRDRRGRIMGGDERYGRLCACGNLKGWQARVCRSCYLEELRDEGYWERRRCPECSGPKSFNGSPLRHRPGLRCRPCANALLVGVPRPGREQPTNHPWRSRIAA
jgi:hypothetical protein